MDAVLNRWAKRRADELIGRLFAPLRLITPFVLREIREQYIGSRLGLAWTLIQPALMVLLYWLVFAKIMNMRVPAGNGSDAPFLVFLLSALLPWFAFSEGTSRATRAVLAKRNVVKHMQFTLSIFPLSAVVATTATHGIGYLLFLAGYFIWLGDASLGQISGLAVIFFLQMVLTIGLGLALSSLAVYIRDLVQVVGIALLVLFYTAPILYPFSFVPDDLQTLTSLNPYKAFAVSYHGLVLDARWPDGSTLGLCIGMAFGMFWLGRRLFRQLQPGFADVL